MCVSAHPFFCCYDYGNMQIFSHYHHQTDNMNHLWIISHVLWLGHEIMACVVWYVLLCFHLMTSSCHISHNAILVGYFCWHITDQSDSVRSKSFVVNVLSSSVLSGPLLRKPKGKTEYLTMLTFDSTMVNSMAILFVIVFLYLMAT